jgi:hypothetical protein
VVVGKTHALHERAKVQATRAAVRLVRLEAQQRIDDHHRQRELQRKHLRAHGLLKKQRALCETPAAQQRQRPAQPVVLYTHVVQGGEQRTGEQPQRQRGAQCAGHRHAERQRAHGQQRQER